MNTNLLSVRLHCSVLATISLLTQGCWASQQVVRYCLTEPTAPLVKEWVDEGDRIEVVLKDQTTGDLVVSKISDTTIESKDGATVSISTIDSLTCKQTERESTWITDLVLGSTGEALVWGGLGGVILLVAIPVAAVAAIQDLAEAPIDDWPDDHLCRISNRPEDFGYGQSGMHPDSANMPSLQEIEQEIGNRDLDCDPKLMAVKSCAAIFTHGPTFTECTNLVEPLERYGPDGIREWNDESLCKAIENPPMLYKDVMGTTGLQAASSFADFLQNEAARRGLKCDAIARESLQPEQVN